MLENIITFIGAHTSWAILIVLSGFSLLAGVFIIVIHTRAEKRLASNKNATAEKPQISMKLKKIQLFPDDLEAEINIVVYVNGVEFFYPSPSQPKWLPVDSCINEEIIELPQAEMYYIRFEINFSSGKKLEGGPLLVRGTSLKKDTKKDSNLLVTFPALPLVDNYKLYWLQDGSRVTSVKAFIPYEIYIK